MSDARARKQLRERADFLITMTRSFALLFAITLAIPATSAVADPGPRKLEKPVEFDYCQARVKAKGRDNLQALAREWRATTPAMITVEGHAFALNEEDSIALGQRRADNVRKMLVRYGVDPKFVVAIGQRDDGLSESGRFVDIVIAP